MLGLLGLRIFEATGADITDLGEEHSHRVLRVCGKGTHTRKVSVWQETRRVKRAEARLPRSPQRADPAPLPGAVVRRRRISTNSSQQGDNPARAVAQALIITRSAAAKQVARAHRAAAPINTGLGLCLGALPAATRGPSFWVPSIPRHRMHHFRILRLPLSTTEMMPC